jgi:hypothetical protein
MTSLLGFIWIKRHLGIENLNPSFAGGNRDSQHKLFPLNLGTELTPKNGNSSNAVPWHLPLRINSKNVSEKCI